MKRFLLIGCNFLSSMLLAQDAWHEGVVVMSHDKVVPGKIMFHPGHDLLVIQQKESRDVITASELKSFRYYDSAVDVNRRFVSLPVQNVYTFRIFEIVLSGRIPVLRKAINSEDVSPNDRDGFEYFFLLDDELVNLNKFRTLLYPRLKNALTAEERKLGLNPNRSADAIRYIQLYNKLNDELLASRK